MTVKTIEAIEGERVLIQWKVPEGQCLQAVSCPPLPVRQARVDYVTHVGGLSTRVYSLSVLERPAEGSIVVIRIPPGVSGEDVAAVTDSIGSLAQFKGIPFLIVPVGVEIDETTRESVQAFLAANPSTPKGTS